jgi:hypothetical protein
MRAGQFMRMGIASEDPPILKSIRGRAITLRPLLSNHHTLSSKGLDTIAVLKYNAVQILAWLARFSLATIRRPPAMEGMAAPENGHWKLSWMSKKKVYREEIMLCRNGK